MEFHQLAELQRSKITRNKNPEYLRSVLEKAKECQGLTLNEVAELIHSEDLQIWKEAAEVAGFIKKEIYGTRLVIFAPLYLSNLCSNDCLYCGFRKSNIQLIRKRLTTEEIYQEVKHLSDEGHKRILLVAGETESTGYLDYLLDAIHATYSAGDIRRINVNVAPLTVEEFARLKNSGIGTYQLFQETYHKDTYGWLHPSGKKANYQWRIGAFERALAAGIDDYGMGILFGLYDYKFDLLALVAHAQYMDEKYGIGPHTISIPRWCPAPGAELNSMPWTVTDEQMERIVITLRLAVPYTGIILSTRENARFRDRLIHLGVSQLSAGSSTTPGGYTGKQTAAQFSTEDHRSLDEVVASILTAGYVPSFCTACYRKERTGANFMELAKSGHVKELCQMNALLTLKEHLMDFASSETKDQGTQALDKWLTQLSPKERQILTERLARVESGLRDSFF